MVDSGIELEDAIDENEVLGFRDLFDEDELYFAENQCENRKCRL